jgi:hypothetical protein
MPKLTLACQENFPAVIVQELLLYTGAHPSRFDFFSDGFPGKVSATKKLSSVCVHSFKMLYHLIALRC